MACKGGVLRGKFVAGVSGEGGCWWLSAHEVRLVDALWSLLLVPQGSFSSQETWNPHKSLFFVLENSFSISGGSISRLLQVNHLSYRFLWVINKHSYPLSLGPCAPLSAQPCLGWYDLQCSSFYLSWGDGHWLYELILSPRYISLMKKASYVTMCTE